MQSRKFNLTSIAPIAVAISIALAGPGLAQNEGALDQPQLISASPLDVVAGTLPMSMFQTEDKATPVPAPQEEQQESMASVYSPSHLELAVPTDDSSKKEEAKVEKSEAADLGPVTMEDGSYSNLQLRGPAPGQATDTTSGAEPELGPRDIAQSVPTDTLGSQGDTRDFDLTPVSLPRRQPAFNRMDGFKYNMLYALPGRMFFSAVVDNSLRAETNVFQTNSNARTDMIYRVLPNVTLGYALTRATRVSANYFFLRDQYTKYNLLDRNFQSVGFQIDHDLYNRNRWTVTAGFLGRALFTTPDEFSSQFFNDLLPQLTVTRQVGYSGVLYGSVMGQIRFREMLSQFQEGDQFYSFGGVYRKNRWNFLTDFTLNNNFGNSNLRQGENNQVIILTEEIAYRLPKIKLPVDAYVRCQQIFNMGAASSPGYAGVNTRVFGGIRASIAKPAIFPVKLAEK